ncbi:MAG: magnesium/cobalt transporter CorA [Candidatus Woesearchaeota archaeon]|jgi:magnesium transporter
MVTSYIFSKQTSSLNNLKTSVTKLPKKDEVIWIDIHENREDFLAIKEIFNIHPLTVDDCLKKETRIKIEVFETYVLAILYGVVVQKGEIKIQEVDFIIGNNFIITNHLNDIEAIHVLHNDPKELQVLLAKGPEFIMQYIVDRLMESFFTAIETIDQEIDIIEAKIFKKADSHSLAKLFKFKQHVMDLKRHTSNHREVINSMAKRTVPFLSLRSEVYFRDTYDKVIRITDFIEIQREIVANIVETHTIMISNRMNEVIKVLTVIATITMPLTVVSSIYGMNFHYMPELGWKYGYAFAWGMMILSVGVLMIFFKRKSWI